MKQHITPEDLLKLNGSQVLNLRDMWMPKPNTMAMARICKDVINDEYDTIVFVIGEVIVQEHSTRLVLRRLVPAGDIETGSFTHLTLPTSALVWILAVGRIV